MGNPVIFNGLFAKNLASDYTFSNPDFDGMQVCNQLTHNASTGIISGGVLSINGDNTKFDLSAGTGQVINYTTPTNPTVVKVSWTAFTAQTVTGLASQDETYIMIDSAGVISQLSNFPTPTERRAKIFIGRIGHSTRTAISFATSFPDYGQSVGSQMFDLYDALGPFNITGNQLTANGANLSFNKSTGSMFFRSFNYPTSAQTPSYVNSAAASPQSFVYRTQTTLNPTFITSVIPGSYDNAGTITAVGGGAGSSTIQRVYLSPNGTVQIQYGQAVYATLTEALASISSESFVVNPGIINTGVLIAYIAINKNCTALNDAATCRLLRAPKFETGVGGGVNTVTSLQQTYNSSSQPQIVLTSGQGGVQVYDNATPIGTDLFKVGSNGGTNFLSAAATGVTVSQLIDSGLTASSAIYANASKQLTSATLTNGQMLIGSTGSTPVAAALTAGTGIGITNAAGSVTIAATGGNELESPINLGISATAAGGTITIALKQSDGTTDPASGTGAVVIGFRDATATNGNYNLRSVTGALSMTLAGATTLGGASAVSYPIYVYAFDNAGTITLGASLNIYDESTLQSSSTTTTSNQVIYQASALSSKPVRLIARITATNTASSWASPTETAFNFPKVPYVSARYYRSSGQGSIAANTNTIMDYNVKDWDSHNAVTTGASWKFTPPIAGRYRIAGGWGCSSGGIETAECNFHKSGTRVNYTPFVTPTSGPIKLHHHDTITLTTSEYIDLRAYKPTNAFTTGGSLTDWVSIDYIGK